MNQLPDLSLNERRLIEMIFSSDGISRVELSQKSGLTGASTTRIVGSLIEAGLLTEEPSRTGAQGQPRRVLGLCPDRYFSAGVTFSVSTMEVALVDLTGSVLDSRVVRLEASTATNVASIAQAIVLDILAERGIGKERLLGVGCSVPGNFGTFATVLHAHPLFSALNEKAIYKAFSTDFEFPYYIENDGTAAALGEYIIDGKARSEDPLFLIHIGHGVGGGGVINGRPYRGAHGNSCLAGALFPYDLPRPSGQDLFETLSSHGFYVRDFPELKELSADASPVIDAWLFRAGQQLRQAVRVATGFFDPTVIVIGGRLPFEFNQRLADVILAEPISGPSRGIPVAPVRASRLAASGGAVGAACIPIFNRFFPGSA